VGLLVALVGDKVLGQARLVVPAALLVLVELPLVMLLAAALTRRLG
jgi:hypothetical protein